MSYKYLFFATILAWAIIGSSQEVFAAQGDATVHTLSVHPETRVCTLV